jgi:cobalt-zinc-cadmium efflux system protein
VAAGNTHDHYAPDHHEGHHHDHHHGGGSRLTLALLVTFGFAIVEVVGGVWSGSLALISDAGHMVTDSLALGLAAFASWVAKRPPSLRHSYGFARAEVIAALLNGILMLVVITGIAVEAVDRLQRPQPVAGGAVMLIAAIGLVVNIVVAFVLSHDAHSLNSRAALIHVIGDLLGSVAALLAGAVIYFTGWMPIDPILSLFVATLILFSTLNLLRQALHVLMEGVPLNLQLEKVGQSMARIRGVHSVHDLHIWNLSTGQIALSAHVALASMNDWQRILADTRRMLHDQFDIDHITLQPEPVEEIVQPYQRSIPIHPAQ